MPAGAVKREVADCAFHAIHAAKTGMFEFWYLATARYRCPAAPLQRLIDHAFDNYCAGRVVGARFGAKPQELNPGRIDVVLIDEPDYGIGCHGVDAMVWPAHTEAAPDDLSDFRPLIPGPLTPVLQPYTIRWHIGGEAADSNEFFVT